MISKHTLTLYTQIENQRKSQDIYKRIQDQYLPKFNLVLMETLTTQNGTNHIAAEPLSKQDIIINTAISTKLLFQSEFRSVAHTQQEPDPTDLLTSIRTDGYKLKLNSDWSDPLHKYKRFQEAQLQQKMREGGSKKQPSAPLSYKNSEVTQDFVASFIDEVTSLKKEKDKKIKGFEVYNERVYNAPSSTASSTSTEMVAVKSISDVVTVAKDKQRMQLDLAETTKLGTIKANNIRKLIKPTWHKPMKLYRVVSGHSGWVRCISVSPDNMFFCTGSNDRTIKFWDLASGKLKITLTGHINAVRGVEFSRKFPLLFSCAEDKTVKCWDLEMNKVVRNYHGHLSGVYALKIHEGLNLLVTGGRDSAARVWDMRLRTQVHVLTGHGHTVGSVATQEFDPQVITGGYDSMIKTWDIGTGRCIKSLTNHKKSIRSLLVHPTEYTFASAASDNIKVWKGPESEFLRNISGHHSILNSIAINDDNVLASGGDDGTVKLWDWKSGYNFQTIQSKPQPGSIAAENGIFALNFDRSGSRLITGECDKTIKFYKQDEEATEETHPISDYRIEFDYKN